MKKRTLTCLFATIVAINTFLPTDASCQTNKGRLIGVLSLQGAILVGSIGGLYILWYKGYPRSRFHFFNDNNEWQQADKCAHATTVYNISLIGYSSYKWAGLSQTQSICFGGLLGFAYILGIEILDGFSSEWGFSPGDFTANTVGAGLFVAQQVAWNEQRFRLGFSFHPTSFPVYNPGELGHNLIQQLIKDYNGQSFWLSCNISSFLPKSSGFPNWLDVALGYGATGMTGASKNITENNGQSVPVFHRYRKFFISGNVDLMRISTPSDDLKLIFPLIDFIKIPAPALEYNTLGQFRFHPIYY